MSIPVSFAVDIPADPEEYRRAPGFGVGVFLLIRVAAAAAATAACTAAAWADTMAAMGLAVGGGATGPPENDPLPPYYHSVQNYRERFDGASIHKISLFLGTEW